MALYEVVLRTRYFEQLCINTWNYFVQPGIGVSPRALELLELMGFVPIGEPLAFPADTIADALATVQSDNVSYLTVEARELYSLTDFEELAYNPPLIGINTGGDSMSPAVAYGLFSDRTRTDIRRGTKRFVGVMEGDVSAGGVLNSGSLTELSALCDKMSDVLLGAAADYLPCIISREKVEIPDTDPVRYKYELYTDPAVQEAHIATEIEWSPYTTVRTQTSRQYGRGI